MKKRVGHWLAALLLVVMLGVGAVFDQTTHTVRAEGDPTPTPTPTETTNGIPGGSGGGGM
jgi:hypothetical protein